MKVRPVKNHLLVQLEQSEETTKSGIILAGSAKESSNIAKVIETADVIDDEQDILLKGDKILINPGAGTEIKLDGKDYLIISQKDVLAIIGN